MKKSWVWLLLALALAAPSLFASGTQEGASQPVTIRWQTANLTEDQYKPIWTEMVKDFEAANPNVKVEPILVARKDDWTKFVTAAQAGQAPDVVNTQIPSAAYQGYIVPIDKYFNAEPAKFRDAWPESVRSAATFEGKLYGLPIWGGTYGEVYNKELVEQAGLDAKNPPVTWADYLKWAKALTKPGQQWATSVLGGPTDTTTRVLLSWIWSNGGEAFSPDYTKATLASDPRSLEAIKFYLSFATNLGIAAPGAVTTNYLEQTQLFENRKIATMRNAYWGFAKVIIDNPELKGKLFVTYPPINTDKSKTYVVSTMAAASISADSKHPDVAWKFIKFNAQAKYSIKRATYANWMPMRVDLLNEPEIKADPILSQYLEIGKRARTLPLPFPSYQEVSAVLIVNAVQQVLTGKATVDAAFSQLDKDLDKKLSEK